jgi:hypothetical protein
MSQFILNDTTINVINAAEAQIAGLKADNKANNQAANDQKIGAYCELIASLAPVKLVKGNLLAPCPRHCVSPCSKRLG